MPFKIVGAVVAAALLILFISPVVVKLKDVALSVVVLIGLVMMVTDIWHALRSKDD
ncbi:MAG: hypothetical protein ABI541_12910 [Betaproteobacteria bacterium]